MNNNILQPLIFDDKKQIFIFVEYLMNISEIEQKELADKIESLNINTIVIRCLKKENENIEYSPKFLQFINKENIKALYMYVKIDSSLLRSFVNLEELGVVFLDNELLNINDFNDLKVINIFGYEDNFRNIKIKNNLDYLLFEKVKNQIFNYSLNLNGLKKLVFWGYHSVYLDKILNNSLNELCVENNKKIYINENINLLKSIEVLKLTKCDTCWLNSNIIKEMINLKELHLEKCDLKFLNNEVFQMLTNLKVLIIDKCKNLESVNNIGFLDRVVILDTKIEDNNIEPLLNTNDVHITHYKTYNLKIN